ncbi:MAG: ribosome silencing factor [Candidatus Didemnitutus sp.]|nr:ribosome silencing factor [Candidatus Didemnitutus sp.]
MTTRKPTKKKTPAKKPAAPRKPKTKSPAPRAPKAAAPKPASYPRLLSLVVQALDAKKTENLQVLHVGELSSITDYLVVGTATSDPHLRALRVELEKVIDGEGAKILGIDTGRSSGWTVVDAFDVMVHLFTSDNREKYRLELLWRDAQPVPVEALL